MTNKEKYKEVFGMNPDELNCPTKKCYECPCARKDSYGYLISCRSNSVYDWWNNEYKEGNK